MLHRLKATKWMHCCSENMFTNSFHHAFRAGGYGRDSIHTYGMVAGMVNCAQGLGAIVGPVSGDSLSQSIGYSWTMTILAFIQLSTVC